MYEFLKRNRCVGKYKLVEGNARAYGLVGKVVCWAAVGALMEWHVTLPYWLSAFCSMASFIYAEKLPDQANAPQALIPLTEKKAAGFWSGKLLPIISLMRSSPFLLLIMLQGVGIFVLARLCQVNLYQPILQEKTFSLVSYGWLMSAMTLFEAWGSARPDWLRKTISDVSAVFVLTVVVALSLSLIAISGKEGTMAGLFLFAYATGLAYPIQRQVLNDAITDSRFRATLLSVESIIDRTICAIIVPFIAGFVAEGKTSLFLHISAGATVVFVAILVIWNSFRSGPSCSATDV